MSEPDQLLDVLQADIVALLKSTPALEHAFIFTGTEKDLATRLNKTFGTRTTSSGGKRGLGIQVLPIFIDEAESNLPGPPLRLRCQILVIENVMLNRTAATGTLKTSSQSAMNVLGALHLMTIGGHSLYAEKTPIAPEKMEDGFEGHLVTLFMRANGLQGPGKPAPVEVELVGGDGTTVSVAGALTSNGTTPVVFPPLPVTGTSDGQPLREAGIYGAGTEYWSQSWGTGIQSYILYYSINGEDTAEWRAPCTDPDNIPPWDPSLVWTSVSNDTGTPIVTGAISTLTLTTATAGAAIRYTTDGSYPTPAKGTLYTAPFAPPAVGTTVRAAAYATGLNPGDVTEFEILES